VKRAGRFRAVPDEQRVGNTIAFFPRYPADARQQYRTDFYIVNLARVTSHLCHIFYMIVRNGRTSLNV